MICKRDLVSQSESMTFRKKKKTENTITQVILLMWTSGHILPLWQPWETGDIQLFYYKKLTWRGFIASMVLTQAHQASNGTHITRMAPHGTIIVLLD